MGNYNLKYNKDDSVIRHAIIALLADLNKKLYFYREKGGDEGRVVVDVPFFYKFTGDDQYIRDNFLFSNPESITSCAPIPGAKFDNDGNMIIGNKIADGNYDVIPRGVLSLNGFAITPEKNLNKRIRSTYHKLDKDGMYTQYSTESIIIPVTFDFDVEIQVTSQLDAFKITEAIIKLLYKTNTLDFEVGSLDEAVYKLPLVYTLPDDYSMETPMGFQFDKVDNIKLTFSLNVRTYIPAFDFESEIHNGRRIFEILDISSNSTEVINVESNIDTEDKEIYNIR